MEQNKTKKHDEKILIVEDDPLVCKISKQILQRGGYQNVDTAFDGKNGLKKWQSSISEAYHLIIIDMKMPKMNGEDLIKEIRKTDENVGIVVITANGDLLNAYSLLEKYQISDFLTKPLKHTNELLFSVRNTLEKIFLKKQLKEYNLQLETRVKKRTSELFNANRELLIAKEVAESANQSKTDFLRSLSHELNTPLNAIIGLSEVLSLMDFEKQREEIIECLESIQKSGMHLHSLIHEMLEFSKIDIKNTDLHLSKCYLMPLLKKCLHMVNNQAISKKIGIVLNISKEFEGSEIIVDENKIKKIIFHFLSNAIMFSFEGGIVTIEAQKKEDGFVIKVCDTGLGVEPENQEKIFLPFFQVNSGFCDKSPGIGLGLNIAKGIVENHNGKIWVESKGKNKGSKFCFSIPQ